MRTKKSAAVEFLPELRREAGGYFLTWELVMEIGYFFRIA